MKLKLVYLLLLFSLRMNAFAQSTEYINKDTIKKLKKWSIAANVNTIEPIAEAGFDYLGGQARLFVPADADNKKDKSYSLGINFCWTPKKDFTVRLSIKLTNYKIDETYNQNEIYPNSLTTYVRDDGQVRQSVINIAPGLVRNFNYKKITFYGGFQLGYKQYNPITVNLRYITYDNSTNTADVKYYNFKQNGGFSIGLGPLAGFSMNLFKNISIGSEFHTSYAYYKTGGKITQVTTFNSGVVETYTFPNNYEGLKFSSVISSINLSVNF
jgi:hypothetical protein